VREFPSICSFEDTWEEAYSIVIDAITTLYEIRCERGQENSFPQPIITDDQFSGRTTFRMPISLHAQLASAAEKDGVSLNQYILSAVSYAHGCNFSSQKAKQVGHGLSETIRHHPFSAMALHSAYASNQKDEYIAHDRAVSNFKAIAITMREQSRKVTEVATTRDWSEKTFLDDNFYMFAQSK
jgi:hypothetical protein